MASTDTLAFRPLPRLLLPLLLLLSATPPRVSGQQQQQSRPSCVFGDRARSLRCSDRCDLRSFRAALREVRSEVDVVSANGCDLRVVPFPLLVSTAEASGGADGAENTIDSLSIINSGLEAMSEDALSGLSSHLRRLDLSGNRLTHLPTALLGLARLEELDLSNNRIKQLPHGSAFNGLNRLVRLDLALNLLGQGENVASRPPSPSSRRQRSRVGRKAAGFESSSSSSSAEALSLLAFNLEPLTDTLEELDLRGNHFRALPSQLKDRGFARLRKLDLSHNELQELPSSSFSGMRRLEYLNLEHAGLRALALAQEGGGAGQPHPLPALRELRLGGNPLRCDCAARWLWRAARRQQQQQHNDKARFDLPRCATPFSVRSRELRSLTATELCELLPGRRVPRFFRVADEDLEGFPDDTFQSISLDKVEPVDQNSVQAEWKVWTSFYHSQYDWSLIFREIGEQGGNGSSTSSMFYKTRHTLARHAELDKSWAPRNETLLARLEGLTPDTYYEVCLSAVEHSTVYYIHRKDCKEVRTREEEKEEQPSGARPSPWSLPSSSSFREYVLPQARTTDLKFAAESEDAVTVGWNVTERDSWNREEPFSVVRKISYRKFAGDNVSRVYVLEEFKSASDFGPRHYTLTGLLPGTAYLVCFDTMTEEDLEREQEEGEEEEEGKEELELHVEGRRHDGCGEVVTPGGRGGFTPGQVAATAVATSSTVVVVALICCCCCPNICGKKKEKKEKKEKKKKSKEATEEVPSRDENDNRHEVKQEGEEETEMVKMQFLEVEGEEEEEGASVVFQQADTSDVPDVGEGDANASAFRDRYSTATLPRGSAVASSRLREWEEMQQREEEEEEEDGDDDGEVSRRFWLSCLSAARSNKGSVAEKKPRRRSKSENPSLYSQRDGILANGHAGGGGHHHHHHHHHRHCHQHGGRRSASHEERRRHSSPAAVDGEDYAEEEEETDRRMSRKKREPKKPKRKHSPKRQAPQPPSPSDHHHHHHHHQMHHHQQHHHHPEMFYNNHLHSLGPGSYHTVSQYQFFKRPVFYAGAAAPQQQQPEFFPHVGLAASRPPPPQQDSRSAAAALLRSNNDYSKTLGRRRRESPMATMPPLPLPPSTAATVPPSALSAPVSNLLELRALASASSTVRSRSRKSDAGVGGSGSGGGATDNYKMYTWSPYSANPGPAAAAIVFSDHRNPYTDYQYRLQEPMLGGGGGRSRKLDELRF